MIVTECKEHNSSSQAVHGIRDKGGIGVTVTLWSVSWSSVLHIRHFSARKAYRRPAPASRGRTGRPAGGGCDRPAHREVLVSKVPTLPTSRFGRPARLPSPEAVAVHTLPSARVAGPNKHLAARQVWTRDRARPAGALPYRYRPARRPAPDGGSVFLPSAWCSGFNPDHTASAQDDRGADSPRCQRRELGSRHRCRDSWS